MGHFFYRVSRDQDIIGFLKEIFWRFKWKWKQFKMGQLHTLESSVNQNQGLVKFIYSEKATKFCENYFWLALHWTSRWRFRKNLWPSQNIWILSGTEPRYNFGIGIGAETFLLGPLLSCQKNSKTNSHVFTLFGVIYICRSLKWTMILKKKLKKFRFGNKFGFRGPAMMKKIGNSIIPFWFLYLLQYQQVRVSVLVLDLNQNT